MEESRADRDMAFEREEAERAEENMEPLDFDDSMLGRINAMKSMVRKDQESDHGAEEHFKSN